MLLAAAACMPHPLDSSEKQSQPFFIPQGESYFSRSHVNVSPDSQSRGRAMTSVSLRDSPLEVDRGSARGTRFAGAMTP